MTLPREPRIHPVSIAALRPTQITVGMREVKAKRKSWRDHPDRKKADFLGKHLIPVIWGPKEDYYVIDHHHLALALHQERIRGVARHAQDRNTRCTAERSQPRRIDARQLRRAPGERA